jgi:hypothetical protein
MLFHGYESSLNDTDYPYENAGWPIMSKRMLNTLLSVREFPHRTWDVPFVGFPDNAPVMMLEKGLRGGVRHENEFVAVQLLEHQDIFDWETSVTVGWVEERNPIPNPLTQIHSQSQAKYPSPTSRHTSLPVHNDGNWNTPNPSVHSPTYAAPDCNGYTLHAAPNPVHLGCNAPKIVAARLPALPYSVVKPK